MPLGQADAATPQGRGSAWQTLAGEDDAWRDARVVQPRGLERAIRRRAGHDDDGVRAPRQRIGDDQEPPELPRHQDARRHQQARRDEQPARAHAARGYGGARPGASRSA